MARRLLAPFFAPCLCRSYLPNEKYPGCGVIGPLDRPRNWHGAASLGFIVARGPGAIAMCRGSSLIGNEDLSGGGTCGVFCLALTNLAEGRGLIRADQIRKSWRSRGRCSSFDQRNPCRCLASRSTFSRLTHRHRSGDNRDAITERGNQEDGL